MPAATLSEVLNPAQRDGYAVAGLVVLGWEEARAYTAAADELDAAIILQAGPGCRRHTPLRVIGAMFRELAERARAPIVLHLDHSTDLDECRAAIDYGFTSVMFDGSRHALSENIEKTAAAVAVARPHGVDVEGELGFVGYAEGESSAQTDPKEAAIFWRETGVSALAVSIGNVHLQREHAAVIDLDAAKAIRAAIDIPIVMHGGSGVPSVTRRHLAAQRLVSKFNIGTELRQVFGAELRRVLSEAPTAFDRIEILRQLEPPLQAAAARAIKELRSPE